MKLGFIQNSKTQCITAPEELYSASHALKAWTLINCFQLDCIPNEKRCAIGWDVGNDQTFPGHRPEVQKEEKSILINVAGFNDPRFIFSRPSTIRLKRNS